MGINITKRLDEKNCGIPTTNRLKEVTVKSPVAFKYQYFIAPTNPLEAEEAKQKSSATGRNDPLHLTKKMLRVSKKNIGKSWSNPKTLETLRTT